jgi:hypothetical protein
MVIKKVIIFTQNKFDKRDFFRFGADLILEAGFELEVYDFTPILRTDHYLTSYICIGEIIDGYVIKVQNLAHLAKLLSENDFKSTFISCFIHLYPVTKEIFEVTSKLKFKYAVYRNNCIPSIHPFYRTQISRLLFYFRINVFGKRIKNANVAFIAGKKANNQIGSKISKKTKIIQVGSIDYNRYIEMIHKKTESVKLYPSIIFIDEYYPLHPDIESPNFISADSYYKKVNFFLAEFTKKTGLTCGIAVHPRANYNEKNPFDYPLFFNETPKCIEKAEIVLGHGSTAFSYAVLSKKPIIQLGFKETRKTIYGSVLEQFSKMLDLPICYLDENYHIPECRINFEKYRRYKRDFLILNDKIEVTDAKDAFVNFIKKYNET